MYGYVCIHITGEWCSRCVRLNFLLKMVRVKKHSFLEIEVKPARQLNKHKAAPLCSENSGSSLVLSVNDVRVMERIQPSSVLAEQGKETLSSVKERLFLPLFLGCSVLHSSLNGTIWLVRRVGVCLLL